MNPEFIQPFIKATVDVLHTMASTQFEVGEIRRKDNGQLYGTVTGLIGLAGENELGNMCISFDQPAILAIVNRMIGEEHLTINQDIVDAVGELTNIICGAAKKELEDIGIQIDMATPTVFLGSELKLSQMAPNSTFSIPCRTNDGSFVIEVNLDKVAKRKS